MKDPVTRRAPGLRRRAGAPPRSVTGTAAPSAFTSMGQRSLPPGSETHSSASTFHDASKVPPVSVRESFRTPGHAQDAVPEPRRAEHSSVSWPRSTQPTQSFSGAGTSSRFIGSANAAVDRMVTARNAARAWRMGKSSVRAL
ncbi:MAG: hypothetical protein HY079_09080 [Elusimicrobia bacterium]|nr:hypothetical protein [Elusimicrobiota bacterium]